MTEIASSSERCESSNPFSGKDAAWENRSLFDDASQGWEPYGRASSRSHDGKSVSAKSAETSSTIDSTTRSERSIQVTDSSSSRNGRSLAKYIDNTQQEEDDLFTTICHQSSAARSKRRVSIMDFGNASSTLDVLDTQSFARSSLDKAMEADPFDSCPAFGSDGFGDLDETDIIPTDSTETMTGAQQPSLFDSHLDESPRSVIPSAMDATFGVPFHEMKSTTARPKRSGPKTLSKTRRVDFTGGLAEEVEAFDNILAAPSMQDSDKPEDDDTSASLKAPSITCTTQESDSRNSGNENTPPTETKPTREKRDSLPAWKLLQRERSRRSVVESPRDSRTSLSLSCHVRRSSETASKSDNGSTRSFSSHTRSSWDQRSFSSHTRRSFDLTSNTPPLTCKSNAKQYGDSSWPAWGSASDPVLPPAFATISDSFPSPPKTQVMSNRKKVRLVPKSGELDWNGFPSPPQPTERKTPPASTPKSCGGKPAWMKRMQWNSESKLDSTPSSKSTNTVKSFATQARRTLSAPPFSSAFFSPRISKPRKVTLTWTREKTNNFSDYTISVVTDSSINDDERRIAKETYYVHKSVVGIGPRGSGLILEKIGQRRSGSITTIVKLAPSAAKAVPLMLDYMYNFNVEPAKVTTETAPALRYLADYFDVPPMFDEVNQFIQKDMNSDNVHLYQAAADELKDDKLIEATQVLDDPLEVHSVVGEVPF